MSRLWNHWSRRFASWSLSSGLSTCSLLAFGAEEPRVRLVNDDSQRPIAIEVTGLTDYDLPPVARHGVDSVEFAHLMAVVVGTNRSDKQPLVSGTYRVERGALRFTPRAPLEPGLIYRVVLHLNDLSDQESPSRSWLESQIVVPKTEQASGASASHN